MTIFYFQAGDADTNACVAGALLGCKLGVEAIPTSWKDKLRHKDWLDTYIQKLVDTVYLLPSQLIMKVSVTGGGAFMGTFFFI